jgi:ribosomal protein S6--L-glutamate ligase
VAVAIVTLKESQGTVLVLGERDWPESQRTTCVAFGELHKRGLRLNPDLLLEIHDTVGDWTQVEGVIWRGQFDEHFSIQHAALSLVRASGVQCVNSPQSILRASDRISLAAELRKSGLPVVPAFYFLGSSGIGYFHTPSLPCVVKIGNWHMGYGKIKASTKEVWCDAADLAFITHGPMAVEPFLHYQRDIRVLVLGDAQVGFERVPSQWRANVCPTAGRVVDVPKDLATMSKLAASAIGADVLGVDWVQLDDERWVLIEANIAPGLQFEELDLRQQVTDLLTDRVGG